MSKAHHDQVYYDFVKREWPECLYCEHGGEQLHHLQVIGSLKYRGPMPRRASSYNVVHLCRECHDYSHRVGDAAAAKEFLGSERQLFLRVTGQLHEYLTWLMEGR